MVSVGRLRRFNHMDHYQLNEYTLKLEHRHINGSVSDEILLQLIDDSYLLVWRGMPKSQRELIRHQ